MERITLLTIIVIALAIMVFINFTITLIMTSKLMPILKMAYNSCAKMFELLSNMLSFSKNMTGEKKDGDV